MCFCIDLLSFWWIIFATSKFQKAASRHPVCALSASDLAFFLTRPLDCDGATAAAMTRRPTRRRVNCAAFFLAPRMSLLSLRIFIKRMAASNFGQFYILHRRYLARGKFAAHACHFICHSPHGAEGKISQFCLQITLIQELSNSYEYLYSLNHSFLLSTLLV